MYSVLCNGLHGKRIRRQQVDVKQSLAAVHLKLTQHHKSTMRECLVTPDSVSPWTVIFRAFLSMEFSRQEYWSGMPFPSPGDLPDPGTELASLCLLHWQADSLPLHHLEINYTLIKIIKNF